MKFKGLLKIKIISFLLLIFFFCCVYENKNRSLFGVRLKEDNKSNIFSPYIEIQYDFCINNRKYFNKNIEDQLVLKKVHFEDYSYYMYLYKYNDAISETISKYGSFEEKEAIHILNALKYYGNQKNITNNKEIQYFMMKFIIY